MDSRRKVVFVIPTLSEGGAQRVMIQILHCIDRSRFELHLALFQKVGVFLNDVPPDVTLHPLVPGKYYFIFRWLLYFKYKKYVSRLNPDVVMSFMWYPNFIVLLEKCFGQHKHRVIVSERTTLAFTYEGRIVQWIRKQIIRYLYPKAEMVLALTHQMQQELLIASLMQSDKVRVIHNPIDIQALKKLSEESVKFGELDSSLPFIISVGRLTIEKGYHYLINAFSQVVGLHPSYLIILGEGPERSDLERLIRQLGLQGKVYIPGFEKNPYKYLARSTLFVLSSIYEGFPNVLIEAMALSLPCIATRCPTGPEEIITDGENGLLVLPTDEKALAGAIMRLLNDPALRKQIGEAGRMRAEDFRVKKIVKEYEDLILSV